MLRENISIDRWGETVAAAAAAGALVVASTVSAHSLAVVHSYLICCRQQLWDGEEYRWANQVRDIQLQPQALPTVVEDHHIVFDSRVQAYSEA